MRLSTEGMAKEIQELKSLNTKIEIENLTMREALKKIADPNFRPFSLSVLRACAQNVLKELPHTDQLAKQREADLRVIEACDPFRFENRFSLADTIKLSTVLKDRDRVYKGEI